ncbi:MAG: diguanylate cyclase [Candidatus Absconditabacteria bacterium]
MNYKSIKDLFLLPKNIILLTIKKLVNKVFYVLNPEFKFVRNLTNCGSNSIDNKSIKCLLGMSNCEQIVGNIPFSITVKDKEGRYIRLSEYLLDSLGKGIESFFGKTDEEIEFKVLSKYGKLCSEKKEINFGAIEYQLMIENKNGKNQYLLMREKSIYDIKGDLSLIISAGYDITRMIELQEQIKSQSNKILEITENLPSGAGYLSSDLIFQYVNPAFCEMYEAFKEHYLGRHLSEFYDLTPQLETAAHYLQEKGKIINVELNSTTLTMKRITVMISAQKIDSSGKIFFTIQDITELKRLQNEIKFMAYNDCVTGLANRHSLERFVVDKLSTLDRNQEKLAILYIDLDGFKAVNDEYGHSVGDLLLREVGVRLKSIIRSSDKIGRVGGDEFVICLSRIKTLEEIQTVIDKIQKAFKQEFVIAKISCTVGASIGVSITNADDLIDGNCEQLAEKLLKQADDAMYRVKNSGKGAYCFFDNKKFSKRF